MEKKEGFFPPNMTKKTFNAFSFSGAGVEATWTNRKKDGLFPRLIGQTHLMFSFSGTTVEATWTNEKEKTFFSPPNKTNIQGEDSLRRIKCAAI